MVTNWGPAIIGEDKFTMRLRRNWEQKCCGWSLQLSPSIFGPPGLVLAGAPVRERNQEPEKRIWRKMSLCARRLEGR